MGVRLAGKGAILGFGGTTPIGFYPFVEKDCFITLVVADAAMTPMVVIPNVFPALVGCSAYPYAFIGGDDEATSISYGYGGAETYGGGATLMVVFSLLVRFAAKAFPILEMAALPACLTVADKDRTPPFTVPVNSRAMVGESGPETC